MLRSILLLSIFSCEDNVSFNTPNLPVYTELNLLETRNQALRTPGGILVFDEPRIEGERLGFGGVLVFRDLSWEKFYAFCAVCPYENDASILLEENGFLVRCPKCKSEFDLTSGNAIPTKGPAQHPLRKYATSYNSQTYQLVISN